MHGARNFTCPFTLLAVLAGCHLSVSKLIDNKQAEHVIAEGLGKRYPVDGVTCPGSIKLVKDAQFTCRVKFTGGDDLEVKATVSNVVDDVADFTYDVTDPYFDPGATAKWVAEQLQAQTSVPAKVDCGAPRHAKAVDTCRATAPDGSTVSVAITVDPTTGHTTGFKVE